MASLHALVARAAGGNDPGASPNSLSGMLSTLIPSFLVALLLVGLFLVLRTKVQRIYMPRTYLPILSAHQKTPKLSPTRFGWVPEFLRTSDEYALSHHSLDAYLFLRFWRQAVILCGFAWPITWIILMPVYGTSHAINQTQFDKISYSNISSTVDANRLYAVAFVSWVVFGIMMFLIGRESLYVVQIRQAFLSIPGIATRMSSRTVLFTSVPTAHIPSEKTVRETFPGVKTVWFVRDTKELDELIDERNKAVAKMEGGIAKMSKAAIDRRTKVNKKGGDKEKQEDFVHWVDENKRPTHRLKFLIGKKVDTINWCEEELQKLNPQIERIQNSHRAKETNFETAVFIEFDSVKASEAAFHRSNKASRMQYIPRAAAIQPHEVIWKNLGIGASQYRTLTIGAMAIVSAMIIFWLPFTAFVGAVSNINSLTNLVPFLSFINDIPGPILGIVTGLLPVIILAVLMALVPIIMRLLFKRAGAVTLAEVELRTQTWYFVFQVIQVFIVTTLSSAAAASVTTIIQDPAQVTNLLASNLPKASNFYINFFVLYGLAVAAQQLFNIVAVLLYYILGKFLDKTPRKKYNRYTKLPGLGWGSLYPKFTNLVVIAITYSCIAPLVLGFATISFFFLGIAFRYAIFYSVDSSNINTSGLAYSKALQQLTTGVYLAEICLIGLMGISTGSSTSATGPLVLMIIFLVATAVYHFLLNRAIGSLEKGLANEYQEEAATGDVTGQVTVGKDGEKPATKTIEVAAQKNANFFVRIMRLPPVPSFASYLQTPMPEYSEEIRSEAYLDPSIAQPAPVVWIARDDVGISQREKNKTKGDGALVVTDEGAWYDKDGKLATVFTADVEEKEDGGNVLSGAPVWEPKVHY